MRSALTTSELNELINFFVNAPNAISSSTDVSSKRSSVRLGAALKCCAPKEALPPLAARPASRPSR